MRVVYYNFMSKLNLIMHVENVEYIFVQKDCPLVTYLRLFAKQKTRQKRKYFRQTLVFM